MSSRDLILGAIRENTPEAFEALEIPRLEARSQKPSYGPFEGPQTEDLIARFTSALEDVGGSWEECRSAADPETVREVIQRHYLDARRIVSVSDCPPLSTIDIAPDESPARLAEVELAIVRGRLGVAENGAVWVDGDTLVHPALPFVAEHLILLLAKSDLVADMHDAYRALSGSRPGYGVFISGPSKTADIEQSLVMGAQGPRTALVLLEDPADPSD